MPSRRSFLASAASLITLWPFEDLALGAVTDVSIWISDPDGMNLAGTVEVIVSATPATNLNSVELYIDGVLVRQSSTSPINYQWDTTTATNGTHVLRGEAVYRKRRSTTQIAVTVSNVVQPPTFPASYFTGPLGANNIVPASTSGALLCLWFGDVSLGGAAGTKTALLQRISDIGRTPHMIGCQLDQLTAGGVNSEDFIHNTIGSIPIINHNPSGTIAQMNAGSMDATWTNVATRLKNSSCPRLLFRTFIEFNFANRSYYMGTTQADADAFANAWRRMVGIFQSVGASNVGFLLSPSENAGNTGGDSDRTQENRIVTAIGPNYVDWLGSDKYNHDTNGFDTPSHGGWAEWSELINYSHTAFAHPPFWFEWGGVKPYMHAETGTKFDTANVPAGHTVDVNRKANWYRNIVNTGFPAIGNNATTGVRAIQFFDQNLAPTIEVHDWRVDHNQPSSSTSPGAFDAVSYQGFKDMVANPIWNAGVA